MGNPHYFESAFKKTRSRFLRLNIANKMLLGFFPLFILTILMAAYALASLTRLNRINRSIVEADIPLIQATDKMLDSLYNQELHGSRYMIIKSVQNMELFADADREFQNEILRISNLPDMDRGVITKLAGLQSKYSEIFMDWFKAGDMPSADPVDYEKKITETQEELKGLIQQIAGMAASGLNEKTQAASRIGARALRTFAVFCIISILIGSASALAITSNISRAITRLKTATQEISKGKFDYTPDIHNQDELGDLSISFSDMAQRLQRLEEMYLDTSPLTHLPGGIAIENVLKKRIAAGVKFAFCLIDLDNFKVYNDHYGYARGNQVIKNTAQIIDAAVKQHGSDDTFVGHIGGDDFVVITSVEHYPEICGSIVEEFDNAVESLYDAKDLRLGNIIHKTRAGREKKFPLMTISIGVVTNENRKFRHYVQVGEIAAEVKNYAKSKPGSLYHVDRRKE